MISVRTESCLHHCLYKMKLVQGYVAQLSSIAVHGRDNMWNFLEVHKLHEM